MGDVAKYCVSHVVGFRIDGFLVRIPKNSPPPPLILRFLVSRLSRLRVPQPLERLQADPLTQPPLTI